MSTRETELACSEESPRKNADARALKPAMGLSVLLLKCIIENINGTTKSMVVGEIGCDGVDFGENAERAGLTVAGGISTNVGSVSNRKSPEMGSDGSRPVMLGKEDHAASGITKVFDATFGDAILVVSIYAAKSDRLVAGHARVTEGSFGKASVVAVIVLDGYTMGI